MGLAGTLLRRVRLAFGEAQGSESPRIGALVALDRARASGLLDRRTHVEVEGVAPDERLAFARRFAKPLGIELRLRERDSELGPPERRVPVSRELAARFRAWALEPALAARLLEGEVSRALLELGEEARRVSLDDRGLRFVVERFDGLSAILATSARLLELLEGRRRTLPKSDHSEELARVWRKLAADRNGELDEGDERLSLSAPHGDLEVYVARSGDAWGTTLELRFARELPEAFELCEREELGLRAWFRAPALVEPKSGRALYAVGSAAARSFVDATREPLGELLGMSDELDVTHAGLVSHVRRVLRAAQELERWLDLALDVGKALDKGKDQGPYR